MQQIADPNSSLVTDDFIDALATVQTNVVDAIAPRSETRHGRLKPGVAACRRAECPTFSIQSWLYPPATKRLCCHA
jgi:hypothetical protein